MSSNKRKIEAQNDTPSKRKVNWLSLSEKLEVIKRSDEGATQKPDFCNLLGPVYNIYNLDFGEFNFGDVFLGPKNRQNRGMTVSESCISIV